MQHGKVIVRVLFLACKYPPSRCVLRLFLCACTWKDISLSPTPIFLLIKPLILLVQDFTLTPSFNLHYLLKVLSPSAITLGVRASTYGFGATQFSPLYRILSCRKFVRECLSSLLLEGNIGNKIEQRSKLAYEVVSPKTSVDPTGSFKTGEDLSGLSQVEVFYYHVKQSLDVDYPL